MESLAVWLQIASQSRLACFGCKINGDLQNILEKFIQFSVDEALEIEEES